MRINSTCKMSRHEKPGRGRFGFGFGAIGTNPSDVEIRSGAPQQQMRTQFPQAR